MTDTDRRRARVATCEDYDEDAQSILPGSRTTANANVSIKRSEQDLASARMESKTKFNGVDSGYVSRADTIVSEPTSPRRRHREFTDEPAAGIAERERQPYSMAQSHPVPVNPAVRRQSTSQSKDIPRAEYRPTKAPQVQVHEWGTCQVCDRCGWHDTREISRTVAGTPSQPPSPTAIRGPAAGRSKDDDALFTKPKRSASTRHSRPLSVVTDPSNAQAFIQPNMYASHVYAPMPPWSTPATPIYAPVQPNYTYPAPVSPPTSGTLQYGPYPQVQPYFDHAPVPEPRSARPSRKSSPVRRPTLYGEPVINQGHGASFPLEERIAYKENRPAVTSHKSHRSIDQDRIVMPPPPKPQLQDSGLTRRPSNRGSKSYIQEDLPLRQRPTLESSRYEQDYDDYIELPPTSSQRARRESSTRPPNSYRGPAVNDSRPVLPRKSVSYSTPEVTTKIASSKPASHRRTTLPSVTLEQKEAAAEAYQRKQSNATPDLTREALRVLEKGSAGSRSETGSSYSHKSQQSSSKDSSRGRSHTHTSATATSITFSGGLNVKIPAGFKSEGRPLSINVGGVTLTMNNSQDRESERPREQKRIERAPSVASKTSRRSFVSSNVSSNDVPKQTSRRASLLEERPKPSRQHSRAPSATGVSYEYTTVTKQSVDPTKYDNYFGA